MKYLEINSNFIKNEFDNSMYRTLDTIRNYSRKGDNNQGVIDCAMSTFGQDFDNLIENYFLDHLRISRKHNHRDTISLEILKHFNVYRKVGVHAMFKKMYPESFKKAAIPSRRYFINGSKDLNFEVFNYIDEQLRAYDVGISSPNSNAINIYQYLRSNGYPPNGDDGSIVALLPDMIARTGYVSHKMNQIGGKGFLNKLRAKNKIMRDILVYEEPEPQPIEGSQIASIKVPEGFFGKTFNIGDVSSSTSTTIKWNYSPPIDGVGEKEFEKQLDDEQVQKVKAIKQKPRHPKW